MKLKQDALKLQSMNQEMHTNITRIESTYINKRSSTSTYWVNKKTQYKEMITLHNSININKDLVILIIYN